MAYASVSGGSESGLGLAPAAIGAGISLVGGLLGGGGPPWQKSYDETKAAIKKGDWATVENKARSQFPKVAALAQKALASRALAPVPGAAPGSVVGDSTPSIPAMLAPGGLPGTLIMVAIGGVVLFVLSRAGRR